MKTKLSIAVSIAMAGLVGCTAIPDNPLSDTQSERLSNDEYIVAESTSQLMQTNTYELSAGETLWSFAARTTGDGQRWREIAELNGIEDVRNIPAGKSLMIPQSDSAAPQMMGSQYSDAQLLPADGDTDAMASDTWISGSETEFEEFTVIESAPIEEAVMNVSSGVSHSAMSDQTAIEVPAGPTQAYTLRNGETLWGFSQRVTGNGANWRTIGKINGIVSEHNVLAGTSLIVPSSMVVGTPEDVAIRSRVTPTVTTPTVATPASETTVSSTNEYKSTLPDGTYKEPVTTLVTESQQALVDTNEGGGSIGTSSVLRPGETLWQFSERTTGDEDNWRAIAKHNDIKDIATVEAWTLLEVPSELSKTASR